MSRKLNEADRARAQTATLASHYRAIGPAAIVAALLCTAKKVDEGTVEAKQAA